MKKLEAIALSLPATVGLLILKGIQIYFWMVWIRWPMKDASTTEFPAIYLAIFFSLLGIVFITAYLLRKKAFVYLAISAFIGASFIADAMTWGIRISREFVLLWCFQVVAGIGAMAIAFSFGDIKKKEIL